MVSFNCNIWFYWIFTDFYPDVIAWIRSCTASRGLIICTDVVSFFLTANIFACPNIRLRVFLTFIYPRHFVTVFAILVIIVVSSIIICLLVQIVQNWGSILFYFYYMFITDGKEFNDFSEHTATTWVDQAGNHFICNITSWSSEHLFKLLCWESLDNYIFLRLFCFIVFLKIQGIVLVTRI